MHTEFAGLEFSTHKGKLSPSAHLIAWTEEDGERQKWRWCLTMNDDGSWQWAPGPPDGVKVPQAVLDSITAQVKESVQAQGIAKTMGLSGND